MILLKFYQKINNKFIKLKQNKLKKISLEQNKRLLKNKIKEEI